MEKNNGANLQKHREADKQKQSRRQSSHYFENCPKNRQRATQLETYWNIRLCIYFYNKAIGEWNVIIRKQNENCELRK